MNYIGRNNKTPERRWIEKGYKGWKDALDCVKSTFGPCFEGWYEAGKRFIKNLGGVFIDG